MFFGSIKDYDTRVHACAKKRTTPTRNLDSPGKLDLQFPDNSLYKCRVF